jgi:uncharacterized protein YjiK
LSVAACGTPQRHETRGADSTQVSAREASFTQALARPDSGAPIARWVLPRDLDEISGLALTADGRLLAHGDELGLVYEIDYRRGVIVKQFALGGSVARDDFEGITLVGDTVVLIASNGALYVAREGGNGARVEYTVQDTKAGRECEIEGVAFDAGVRSLLFVCKNVFTQSLRDSLVIFRWRLDRGNGPRLSKLTVPLRRVIGSNGWDGLHPSDITIDPFTGYYLIVASREKALIEITPAGDVIFARPLPGTHVQAEGIALTRDGLLIVSDEGRAAKGQPAVLTLYRWRGAR